MTLVVTHIIWTCVLIQSGVFARRSCSHSKGVGNPDGVEENNAAKKEARLGEVSLTAEAVEGLKKKINAKNLLFEEIIIFESMLHASK